ncbi:MAG: hypothetical protein IPP81_04605 [Chitinophagaceae bacterium]|nr:hypothetical protein [Chitinophagaceae bacterium]
MNGYQYRAIVTGAAPCAAQTSRVATLTVNPLPVTIAGSVLHLIPACYQVYKLPCLQPLHQTLPVAMAIAGCATAWCWQPLDGVVSGIGTGSLRL